MAGEASPSVAGNCGASLSGVTGVGAAMAIIGPEVYFLLIRQDKP